MIEKFDNKEVTTTKNKLTGAKDVKEILKVSTLSQTDTKDNKDDESIIN